MKPRILRWAGLAVLLASAGALAVSIGEMSRRLSEEREIEPVTLHYFIGIESAEFEYLGRDVRLSTLEATDEGEPIVEARYGDQAERLVIAGRDVPALGDLERHQDWMRVLLLAGEAGKDADRERLMEEHAPGSHVVVVARQAAPGYDARTWGQAHYKDWMYEFLVLTADGRIDRFSRTYRELAADPRSWEFVAAMNVTPSLHTPAMRSSSPISYPNYGPVRQAIIAMGWTWPAAGVAVLTGFIGVMMIGASFVSRDRTLRQRLRKR